MFERINIQSIISYIGSIIVYLFGGVDTMFITLLIFMGLDYITGLMKGVKQHKLSSRIGFTGLARKFIVLGIVCIGALVDRVTGTDGIVRTFVITFYLCNEGVSILENASVFNVPFPQKLRSVLLEFNKENKEVKK